MSNDPGNTTYEIHAPTTIDDQGYAYSPQIGTVDAPTIEEAAQIVIDNVGPCHPVGQGGDDEYTVIRQH
jgi:hypothetical protein